MRKLSYNHVAVLMGGPSAERPVSLKSGAAVAQGLRDAGYAKVSEVDVTEADVPDLNGAEAVFVALHGAFGEDGQVQQILEARGIPYAGTRAADLPVSFDKVLSKNVLREHQLPVAPDEVLAAGQHETTLPVPFVVKPPLQGSSIGISVVTEAAQWPAALAEARKHQDEVLVEQFIDGRELTVGILGETTLPVVEICAPSGTYDYDAKYVYSQGQTEYKVPAPLDAETETACCDLALKTFRALGGLHLGRVDFRLDPAGTLFILELNTIPGFTPTSLLPKSAVAAGIPFPELCRQIMEMAQ